ncbi:MAG: peroxiredoxin [Microbacterium sp.]
MDVSETRAESLTGRAVPNLWLTSTFGPEIDLAAESLGNYVLFIYPRTGRPDRVEPAAWSSVPGAKGCTAESCEFRNLAADFAAAGYSIFGLSSQDTDEQREAALRLDLPYWLLSDPSLELAAALQLETFEFEGETLYKRSTLVVTDRTIALAELEVSDPESHPRELLARLR